MGGENQSHQPTILQNGHSFANDIPSSSANGSNNNVNSSSYNYNNSGMSNEQFVNNMMRQVDDNSYRPSMQQSQQTLPNLDLNSILGLSGNNSAVPNHLGHHGGHHLVTHLMGTQYNFSQPPQPAPAYTGPTHSVLPSLPMHVNNNMNNQTRQPQQQQQQYNNPPPQQYMNQQNNLPYNNNNNGGMNGMMNGTSNGMMSPQMMSNMNGGQNMGNDNNNNNNGPEGQDIDAYSQDVLLLVVEQQRRIYHLEEELQKANEYINKLQEYAKNLELDKEKHAKKQSRYWTQQEHQKFLQGIEKYGRKDVKAISNFVGSRNPTQVRTHAQKYYAKIEREQRRALGPDGKRNSIGNNSNSSGNESDDDVLGEDFVSDGSGSSGSGNGNGPTPDYENFAFPAKSTTQDEQTNGVDKSAPPAMVQPEVPSQVQQVV